MRRIVRRVSLWMALEVLSPQTVRNRSEFELGNRHVLGFGGIVVALTEAGAARVSARAAVSPSQRR